MLKRKIAFIVACCILLGSLLLLFSTLLPEPLSYQPLTLTSHNDYDYQNLNQESQFYSYQDANYQSAILIDVSEHNGNIDFAKVKSQGIDFIYLRLGWRGYTEGKIYLDRRFEEYYRSAAANGFKIGCYFFSQAIDEAEAIAEASFLLENIQGKHFQLPIAYDYEDTDEELGRIKELTLEEKTANAAAFLKTITAAGYQGIIYANLNWLNNSYDPALLSQYPIWLAQYAKQPQYQNSFAIWQYSDSGIVEGIENPVDLNLLFIPKEAQ